jgi:DUF4097 and DUF4098 domain-containing protein YvlB
MKRILLTTILALAMLGMTAYGQTIRKEFDLAMGGKLEMDLDTGGDVYISGWDKDKLAVKVHISGVDEDEYKIDFDKRSSGLEIRTDYRGRWERHDGEFEFDLKVPRKFDLEIDTKAGAVHVADVDGRVDGKTMGGGLDFRNINGDIEFTTMGGEIEVSGTKGYLRLKTMGGGITVTDSEADGKVSTMGGSILIENVKGDLKGSTMGGNVIYRNAGGRSERSEGSSSDDLRVSTMGGDINVDEAPNGADVNTLGGSITVHSAKDYVKAETLGGDITVDEIDGWVSASTLGGNVTVNMTGDPKKGRRDVTISSLGGDITLTVPADLSMEFDIEIAYTKDSDRDYRIISDFDIKQKKTSEWEGSFWRGNRQKHIYGTGSVEGGRNRIKISTINGDVYIRKGA